MKKCLFPFFALLLLLPAGGRAGNHPQKQAPEWIPFYWESDTISGKYIEKAYLYVPVKIEDLPDNFSMQLDLGTAETQFYGIPLKPYLEKSPVLAGKLGAFEGAPNALFRNVGLHLGPVDMQIDVWHRAKFGEVPRKDPARPDAPIHIGTIAPDIFQDQVLIIDYKSRRFAVSDELPARYKNLPAGKFELNNGIILLPFRIGGEACRLMLDTGSSPFPLATSKERALAISDSVITDSLSGPLWWGRDITFYGMKVNKPVELGGRVLKNGTVYYDKEGLWNDIFTSLNVWGLTGNAYFSDHILILDYKNKLFRMK